ncbi:Pyridoxamine 5'-phosphate oxidase [Agromyces sp. CF514]|uniref:pyridoxamine 5'-phosphate oxidase family protein n=1 Tax=Agromyces sp. CF514 TaxID=1881031 RepID=UPI0008EDF74F|nr:pyridoxamine 5'-phosphate oxidase family protein [Agromyces sp. CF514]SFR68541.1 Pyridoxamine 5'-phosphate oxidase [Agromyces sp. CF514]
MVDVTNGEVWKAISAENFMVIGMVTARGESRTAGVMHAVHDERIWFTSHDLAWKTRHISANRNVSITVPVAKRVPLMPWIKIPAATVTFSGDAEIVPVAEMPEHVRSALLDDIDVSDGGDHGHVIGVSVRPRGDFVTYGVGVSALGMRDTEAAAGRVRAASVTA